MASSGAPGTGAPTSTPRSHASAPVALPLPWLYAPAALRSRSAFSCVLFRSRRSAFHALRRPQLQIGGRLAFCHLAASGSSSARADPGAATPSRAPSPRPAPASWSCSCPGARRRPPVGPRRGPRRQGSPAGQQQERRAPASVPGRSH
ncbi:hypothetical protein PAHAL_7G233000 [Panicum hallii]|uniref:Uncharacterized protein n=1 Tax=Panicum hallii TaxID=206008 RepID=A0A2T8ID82_9POAL|nr:hypothetical protein PAHAL_7G233000 [Panicum hallii]